jgi:hypothetical protein
VTKKKQLAPEMRPFTRDLIKVRVKNMATERVCKEEQLSESSFDIDGMKE